MTSREVVECINGPACKGDHHGWDCPLSDPLGDVLRSIAFADPLANPILEESRLAILKKWLGENDD